MALKPVPGIDLESLPEEARSLIETLAQRAQDADRLEQENRLLREMLRLERLKKYGPKGEKLSEEQVELLELEPDAQEVEKEAEVSSGRKRLTKREHAGRNAPACSSAAARGDHCRGRRGEALRVLRGGALPHWLRGKGSPRDRTGPLLRARDQARETGLPQMSGGGVATAAAGGPKIVEKGKLSDAVVVDVLIKKYLSHLPLYRQAADLHRDHGIEIRAAR